MTPEPLTFALEAVKRGKDRWTLTLAPDHLELRPEGGAPVRFTRDEAAEKVSTHRGPGGTMLSAKVPKRTVWKATPEVTTALADWRGPVGPADLRVALKRRLGFAIPIAILLVVTSMPMPADSGTGLAAVPLDAVGMLLGVSLLFLATLRRVWQSPKLLFLDTLWFIALAADLAHSALGGEGLLGWIFLPLIVWAAWSTFREYERFADADFELGVTA